MFIHLRLTSSICLVTYKVVYDCAENKNVDTFDLLFPIHGGGRWQIESQHTNSLKIRYIKKHITS